MASEHVLGEWRIRQGLRIKVSISEHRDRSRLDIRQWYLNDDGDWRPSRAGVSIPPEQLDAVLSMLQRAKALLQGKIPAPQNGAGPGQIQSGVATEAPALAPETPVRRARLRRA